MNTDYQDKASDKKFIDKVFKDKEGKVTLAQPPNLTLMVWLASTLLSLVMPHHTFVERLLEVVAFGALFTWAWQELFEGVNYFRRALGLIILVILILSAVSSKPYLHYVV